MSDGVARLAALALVVVPLGLGWVSGARVRAGPRGWRRVLLVSVVGAVFAVVAIDELPMLAAWDIVSVVALFVLGLVVRVVGVTRPVLFGAGVSFALLALELAVRVALPGSPAVPAPSAARVTFPSGHLLGEFHFPTPKLVEEWTLGSQGPRVMYLGDSMVEGLGVHRDEAVVSRVATLRPSMTHIRAAHRGSGPDDYLVASRNWSALARPDHVIVTLFLGNDLEYIGSVRSECDCRPLVDFGRPETLPPTCSAPSTTWPLYLRLAKSAPPYALRVVASSSAVGGHLLPLFGVPERWVGSGALGPCDAWPRDPVPERLGRLASVLRVMRREAHDAGRGFGVIVLPTRSSLHQELGLPLRGRDPHFGEGPLRHRQVVELVAGLGLPYRDLGPPVLAAFREQGGDLFLPEGVEDVHFSPSGHRLFAEHLASFVDELAAVAP